MSESTKILTPEQVAATFVKGILREKYHILPGEAKWIWRINRFFPGLVRRIIDHDLQKIRASLT